MAYTTIDDPEAYFQVKLYTGGGEAQAITFDADTDMQPDLVWIKRRDSSGNHKWYDSVRGVHNEIYSNSTAAEYAETQSLTAFGSDGYTVGTDAAISGDTRTFLSMCWKAGTASSGTTTGSGTGTAYSTSIDDTAGFQITTYTGNDTGGHTIPVALSTAPQFMIFKQRNDVYAWGVYHHENTAAPETEVLEMHATAATADDNTFLNDVAPTASVVTLGPAGDWGNEDSKTIAAYFWSEKQGYSKFGTYPGNGNANGPFVWLGFRPAWIMIKCTTNNHASAGWRIWNNKMDTFNPVDNVLDANTNSAEDLTAEDYDFCANGFKVRAGGLKNNDAGETYIYIAFAEQPFVNSEGVPANAR